MTSRLEMLPLRHSTAHLLVRSVLLLLSCKAVKMALPEPVMPQNIVETLHKAIHRILDIILPAVVV